MIYKNTNGVDPLWDTLLQTYPGNVFIIQVGHDYNIIFETIKENTDLIKNVDKVIVISTTEAFFSSIWFEIIEKLKSCGMEEKNILVEDAGKIINPKSRKWFQTTFHYTIGEPDVCVKKDKILLSLARYARPFRVVMTNELLNRNILPSEKILMTCGSSKEDFNHWFNILPESSKKFFPITTFGQVGRSDFIANEKLHENTWARALINLVMESGFNYTSVLVPGAQNKYIPLCESWDRPFFTEKTEKAFRYHQVPIFVAPAGYVQYLRDLNYDLFDDFIDHSYDMELDPYVRIKMIANEVEKISKHLMDADVEDYSVLVNEFHQRTEQNYLNLIRVHQRDIQNRIETVNQFLNV